jgi:hypothetical protein
VRCHPHEPKFCFARLKTLLELGYPELAAGDFEKTIMLVEYGLDYSPVLGESVLLLGLQKWINDYHGVSFYSFESGLDVEQWQD